MARPKTQSYSRALRTPINPTGDLDTDKREVTRSLALLIEHYIIDPSLPPERVWTSLAINLAFAHVPCFQIRVSKKKGRRIKWDLEEARRLVAAVDAHKSSKGIKVAIGLAIKEKDWGWGREIGSIETRYHEAKRQIMRYELAMRHPPYLAKHLLAFGDFPQARRAKKIRTR
jgi:hypothetical protein